MKVVGLHYTLVPVTLYYTNGARKNKYVNSRTKNSYILLLIYKMLFNILIKCVLAVFASFFKAIGKPFQTLTPAILMDLLVVDLLAQSIKKLLSVA